MEEWPTHPRRLVCSMDRSSIQLPFEPAAARLSTRLRRCVLWLLPERPLLRHRLQSVCLRRGAPWAAPCRATLLQMRAVPAASRALLSPRSIVLRVAFVDLLRDIPHLALAHLRILVLAHTRRGGRQGEQRDEEHGQLHCSGCLCTRAVVQSVACWSSGSLRGEVPTQCAH